MGKVYDALRRAEAQRSQQRTGVTGLPVTPLDVPVDRGAGGHAGERRPGRLSRLLARVRPGSQLDEAGAINKRRMALLHPDSYLAEQFRTLRARLESMSAERPLRSVAVASALPGEGKTMAAVNLAVVTSMGMGRRVLLVDCDLRRPKVHTALGLRPEYGIAEVLNDQAPLDRAVIKVEGTNLEVLPVRGTPPHPSELLSSDRMRALVEELARSYDFVIYDTPPTLSLPDAKVLSERADGVVLVVRADQTPQDDVQAALDLLDRRRVLGIVLNGVATDTKRYGY